MHKFVFDYDLNITSKKCVVAVWKLFTLNHMYRKETNLPLKFQDVAMGVTDVDEADCYKGITKSVVHFNFNRCHSKVNDASLK